MDKKTIIICDDNDPYVAVMSQVLKKNGYDVLTASDGGEGLELVRSAHPDLLLLDLEMPGVDGMGVLRGLSDIADKPYTVVISAQEAPARKEAALAAGAREFWTKPFNPAALIKRIQSLIAEGQL